MNNYQWQGQKVKVTFGYVNVTENIEKPLYWYNYECHQNKVGAEWKHKFALIPAVKVTTENSEFLLSNQAGLAVHKLINGGWPNYSHSSLNGKFTEDNSPVWAIKEFDEEEYCVIESARNKWFSQEYPEEWNKLKELQESYRKIQWVKRNS